MYIRHFSSYFKNLCFLSYISGHVWFNKIEKGKQNRIILFVSPFLISSCFLYKVIPLLTHYILAILHVSISPNHHLWTPPGRPFSLCLVFSKSSFMYLLRYRCLPEACPDRVSALLCVPTSPNISLWVTACLKPVSCRRVWAPWGWGQCSHYCWPTAGLWLVRPLPSCLTC